MDHKQWSFRVSPTQPWGRSLLHVIPTTDLLAFPMAFTQSSLLSPDDFVKRASERGVSLRVEHLTELHRVRALVPLLRILQRPSDSAALIPVSESTRDMYHQVGTPLAHSIEAAGLRQLIDPGPTLFRNWEKGIKIPGFGRVQTYPSAFYSPYQLIGLRAFETLTDQMEAIRIGDHGLRFRLPAPRLTVEEIELLDGGRRLATVLHALDMQFLPQILLTISYPAEWEHAELSFDVKTRLDHFGIDAEQLASTADALLSQAQFLEPLGDWYELVRQAHPSTWTQLKGDARLAMDFRIAAELLLGAVEDIGRTDLTTPPPRTERVAWVVLDDRLRRDPDRTESALTARGLYPAPALLLVLEGNTEMLLMPDVLAELYGGPVPESIVQIVGMESIDRDLDLLVRREVAPRLGESHGDFVWLVRPPTRMLVAVDPEKRYASQSLRERERTKLVARIYEHLDAEYQTASSKSEVDLLVEITSWGKYPWEFANFTNAELARGIESCVAIPSGLSRTDLIAALQAERTVTDRSPNVDRICKPWPHHYSKVQLARALRPRLIAKVQADAHRRQSEKRVQTPATRVAARALELVAISTHRRNVVLPI